MYVLAKLVSGLYATSQALMLRSVDETILQNFGLSVVFSFMSFTLLLPTQADRIKTLYGTILV